MKTTLIEPEIAVLDTPRYCQFCHKELFKKEHVKFCSHPCYAAYTVQIKEKWSVDIAQEMHEAIEGLMLSDGSLEVQKTAYCPRFNLSQSESHLDYINYFKNLLSLGDDRVKYKPKYHKKLMKTYGSYSLTTTTSHIWTPYFDRWYKQGKKIIPEDFKLTPISLLHTYLGDGCLSSYNGKDKANSIYYNLYLYLMNFSRESIERVLIPQFLQHGIDFKINDKTFDGYDRKYPVMKFGDRASLANFFKYIAPNPVRCYDYKFLTV